MSAARVGAAERESDIPRPNSGRRLVIECVDRNRAVGGGGAGMHPTVTDPLAVDRGSFVTNRFSDDERIAGAIGDGAHPLRRTNRMGVQQPIVLIEAIQRRTTGV